MGNVERKFLGCSANLAETAAAELLKLGRGKLPVDFSHLRVVVPTAEAGRLLREMIALRCAETAGGAVNLDVVMPEQLLHAGATATPTQTLLAWVGTLRAADGKAFPELFRNDVLANYRNSDEVLLGWSETFQLCRTGLAAEGLSLADATGILSDFCKQRGGETDEINYCRFAEFRTLETAYLERLAAVAPGRPDPAAAILAAAAEPKLPEQIEKVILIDCADLAGAPRRWLAALPDRVAVECWVTAEAELAEHFDDFGRPDPGFWNSVPIALDFATHLRIVPRPDQQAKKLLEVLTAAAKRGTLPSAVGVLDPEVAAALETHAELAAGSAPDRNKVPEIFVPRQTPLAELPWSQLFSSLVRLGSDASVAAAAEVWASPLLVDCAAGASGIADVESALELLDELRQAHFVDDMDFLDRLLSDRRDADDAELAALPEGEEFEYKRKQLRRSLFVTSNLQKLAALARRWRARIAAADNPVTEAYAVLAEIGSRNQLRDLSFNLSEAEVRALRQLAAEFAEAPPKMRELLPSVLKRRLSATRIKVREEPADAVDAVGFLELPWRSDPTVLVAGFNDDNFGSGSADDIFLSDSVRRILGMVTDDRRRAADALRFRALLASRKGEVYILCGRSAQSGETLRPSRLLLQCDPDELPARVAALFSETAGALLEEPPPPVVASPPFLPRRAAPHGMSITHFKTYFDCPFSFYLSDVLNLSASDPELPELDAMSYGTFVHGILEKCPRDGAPDAETLEKLVDRLFARETERNFGRELPALLKLQCGLVAESLKYFARSQYKEFAAGWRILRTELPIATAWGGLFRAVFPAEPAEEWRDAVTLRGKIDRIDCRKLESGEVELRVLDYKTSNDAKPPAEAHLDSGTPRFAAAERFAFTRVDDNKAVKLYWIDLQLPLYVLLLKHLLQGHDGIPAAERIFAGYFMLPLELTATGVAPFDDLETPGVLESAARCTDAMLRKIFVEGDFSTRLKRGLEIFPGCSIPMTEFRDPPAAEEAKS